MQSCFINVLARNSYLVALGPSGLRMAYIASISCVGSSGTDPFLTVACEPSVGATSDVGTFNLLFTRERRYNFRDHGVPYRLLFQARTAGT